jgi:hypothetical protein
MLGPKVLCEYERENRMGNLRSNILNDQVYFTEQRRQWEEVNDKS